MDLEQALSGRAGLTGLQWLLAGAPAHEVLRDALANLLEDGALLGEIMLQRAKYKPGRYLTTYHAARVLQGSAPSTRLVEANWRMPGSSDPRGEQPELLAMQEEAITRGLAAPFRELLAEVPAWGLYLQ